MSSVAEPEPPFGVAPTPPTFPNLVNKIDFFLLNLVFNMFYNEKFLPKWRDLEVEPKPPKGAAPQHCKREIAKVRLIRSTLFPLFCA